MRISFNASAVIANNALNNTDNLIQESLARLSSGLKVVNAKDNPSGLAMSKRMNAQIEGLKQANQNSGDGISVIEIADGTMAEIHDMLQRMNELAVKGATGTLTPKDREMIDQEMQQLKEEIQRVSEETQFNGQNILDGSFDLRGYSNNADVKVAYYDNMKTGSYEISLSDITWDAEGQLKEAKIDATAAHTQNEDFPADARVSAVDGHIVTIKGGKDFELKLRINEGVTAATATLDITNFGAMDMQIGANEGQQLGIRIPKMSLENMGISAIHSLTEEASTDAITKIDLAIKYVSSARSTLGAYQNRLEHTISSLDISTENMTAAYSRIMDVDMAEEMTSYTTLQILSQASTSMLAQANERPQEALQLLQ